jgi:hypothetical protein
MFISSSPCSSFEAVVDLEAMHVDTAQEYIKA